MWPEELFDFGYIPLNTHLQALCDLAEDEDWEYHHTASDEHEHPVLYHYIRFTYKRLAEEGKIGLSEDGQYACFNTGLVTDNQEPIFASFEAHRRENAEPWYFKGWFRKGQWELKVHRLKAMGSGDTNTLSRLKPTFAAAQTAAFRRRSFGGSGPFGTS